MPAKTKRVQPEYVLPINKEVLIDKAKEALVAFGFAQDDMENVTWKVSLAIDVSFDGQAPFVRGEGREISKRKDFLRAHLPRRRQDQATRESRRWRLQFPGL
ncbi:MAG: hypothetical protein RR893_11185 [Clostridia bacterium]